MSAKLNIFFLWGCVSCAAALYAQNPDGMEYQTYGQGIGRQEPKGLQRQMVGSVTVLESNKEYAARNIAQLEQAIAQINESLGILDKEIAQIKAAVSELQSRQSTMGQNIAIRLGQLENQIVNLYDANSKNQQESQPVQGAGFQENQPIVMPDGNRVQ